MAIDWITAGNTYILANGGYAAVGASIGVAPATLQSWAQGNTETTTQIAVGMAPLLGTTVPILLMASDFP